MNRRRVLISCIAIVAVVFIAYFNALKLGFYGDDWIFYDLAGRLNLADYLAKYFDPRLQTAWYRPVQGVLFRAEYEIFGANPLGYHLLNVLVHLANCFWLYGIVWRVTRRARAAFVAALIFATLPIAALAVFWPGVIDSVETFFYLASIWFWLGYLQSMHARNYWLAFGAFLFALLSKEIGVTLPITLFLIDRFIIGKSISRAEVFRRYVWFAVAWLVYLPIEYIVTRRSVFITREGYSPGLGLVSNLMDYLSALAFPWFTIPPVNYGILLMACLALAYAIFVRKMHAFIPIIIGAVLAILPVALFPFVANRFLYLSLVASAIMYAALIDWLWQRAAITRALAVALLVVTTLWGSATISDSALGFGEWARVARVPFRNVSQAHPTFAPDTYLYFVDPPVPGTNLSGMFFWRYGTSVAVGATDGNQPAGLRDHANTFVYVFDAQGEQLELRVEKNSVAGAVPPLPVTFAASIRLEGFELVSEKVKSNEPIVLFLYWRGLERIPHDYIVGIDLIDSAGKSAITYRQEPRRGKSPTSAWKPGELVVDAIQVPVSSAAPGSYQLAVGLIDPLTQQFIAMDSIRQVIISPVSIFR
jgi:hypothetical protein